MWRCWSEHDIRSGYAVYVVAATQKYKPDFIYWKQAVAVTCLVSRCVNREGRCELTSGVELRQVVEHAAGGAAGLDQVASEQRDGPNKFLPGWVFLRREEGG